ncbi:ParA family protein [Bacillus sp. FJAT-42376]|uniref:ParA family protein n=1 Tax=Bacillus sp. FJAT-42376 TaxID=2014076 RepID=UPI000F4D70AA|nr:ParA family protein [Bacillus sp. FJAT-42376]AZB42323.1 ParA family protein [Bacillus sp. FJAT-42376]
MVKIISFFNHKGGVSKTTTTFHLGWILAELGKKVLLVDADPQCNLTGVSLSLTGNDNFEEFYNDSNIDDIKSCLNPVFEGKPVALKPAKCFEFPGRENLFLLPGNIGFSEFDVSIGIAQELTGSLRMTQNIPGAISHLLRITGEEYKFDYILIDMSPSVSATNSNILMQSHYFIVPCSPDYFCNMAINSLSKVIPSWYDTYNSLTSHSVFKDAVYKMPETKPKFIGTILQRYRPRNGAPARAFQQWINRINSNVNENLVPVLKKNGMIINEDKFSKLGLSEEPYNITNMADFNGLIAQSQKYNVPVFALTSDQIEQVGRVLDTSEKSRDEFHKTFVNLANNVVSLTS